MRQAADILSSAPAMQIRYLEAMQAMAKSANSKVIFLPGAAQAMSANFASSSGNTGFDEAGGASKDANFGDFSSQDQGFNQALNARVIENI